MRFLNVKTILMLIMFVLAAGISHAQTAKEIMIKADKIATESSNSMFQKMKLSTCKYAKKGKKTVCTKNPRIKLIESAQKDVGSRGKDSKSISFILEPIGEKGMGMLIFDYDDSDKDTISWLYLSAMGKVKKIISGTDDDDESGSFFGSEFLIEDMENHDIEDYTYKILKETVYQKRPVWIIESIPTPKRLRKSKYGKSHTWIDKERFIELKVQLYNKQLKPYKQITMRNIENIDGVWTPRKITIKNLKTKRTSVVSLISVSYNIEIPEQFLTQRALTDFAYREREMIKIKRHLK
jgi:hypothetical protein